MQLQCDYRINGGFVPRGGNKKRQVSACPCGTCTDIPVVTSSTQVCCFEAVMVSHIRIQVTTVVLPNTFHPQVTVHAHLLKEHNSFHLIQSVAGRQGGGTSPPVFTNVTKKSPTST